MCVPPRLPLAQGCRARSRGAKAGRCSRRVWQAAAGAAACLFPAPAVAKRPGPPIRLQAPACPPQQIGIPSAQPRRGCRARLGGCWLGSAAAGSVRLTVAACSCRHRPMPCAPEAPLRGGAARYHRAPLSQRQQCAGGVAERTIGRPPGPPLAAAPMMQRMPTVPPSSPGRRYITSQEQALKGMGGLAAPFHHGYRMSAPGREPCGGNHLVTSPHAASVTQPAQVKWARTGPRFRR